MGWICDLAEVERDKLEGKGGESLRVTKLQ
jgi:hypothetical protein